MAKTSITAKLGLDTTAFQRGLAKSQKSIGNFVKSGIAKFGALAGAAGLGSMAKSAIDLGSKISDMAVQLNIGTTELQTLDYAAREAGVATEVMARALRNVQTRTEEAIKGNKSYGDAFKQLGIDVNEFKKLSVEKRLEAIAIAQSKATDAGAAYNSVARILGEKAGPAMQEVLQNLAGPEGYGGLEAAAKRANEVMSEGTIAKMDKAADKIESFKRKMTVLTSELLTVVVPAFSLFSNGLGTVSDMIALLTGKFLTFLGFLSRSVSKTIEPIVKQFESLSMGIKGVMLGLKREFGAADAAFKKSADLQKKSWEALKKMPSELAKEAKRANEEMEIDNKAFKASTDKRREEAKKSWADLWDSNADKAKESMDKVNDAASGSTSGGGAATAVASSGKAGAGGKSGKNDPMGLSIERGEFEARNDFLRRREKARAAHLLLNHKLQKQAMTGESAGITDQLIQAARGNVSGSSGAEQSRSIVESANSLKAIERELTRTN